MCPVNYLSDNSLLRLKLYLSDVDSHNYNIDLDFSENNTFITLLFYPS